MNIVGFNEDDLKRRGGILTAREIFNQPKVWQETYDVIMEHKIDVEEFLNKVLSIKDLKVIFTGAGTSGYIGEIVKPYLSKKLSVRIESIPTTDIVSHPSSYLNKDIPTLLISFARSGNSPESVATVELAKELVDNVYQIVLTCNPDGKLARIAKDDINSKLILMPEDSNDQGFAMTSSFTSMVLASLLMLELNEVEKLKKTVDSLASNGQSILNNISILENIVNIDFRKIIYLGASSFYGLAKESGLKILELTGGKIVPSYNTPLGFRHGPKSIIDDNSLIVLYMSEDLHARKYEYDLLKEIYNQNGNHKILVISSYKDDAIEDLSDFYVYIENHKEEYEECYITLNYILYAQVIALSKSLILGKSPDNPSPDGNVNRVVKGVTIYPYNK